MGMRSIYVIIPGGGENHFPLLKQAIQSSGCHCVILSCYPAGINPMLSEPLP